ncbi:zinc finger, CCHC-type containing protein [Tanacetum coccineum]
MKFVEQLIGLAPDPETADPDAIDKYYKIVNLEQEVACLMLSSMSPDLQRTLEKYNAYDMMKELKIMFEEQAKQELYETVKAFYSCKQEEGQSVSSYLLKKKSYLDTLECLGYAMLNELGVSLILNSLNKDYDQFVQNYNMHSMGKTIAELHDMLKLHEKGIPKKAETSVVLAIWEGKIQKDKRKLRGGKGRGRMLAWLVLQGLKRSNKLKHGALRLYMGNGMRAAVEAIGSFDLILPSGLIIVLDNCHYIPTVTRGVVSISHLVENGTYGYVYLMKHKHKAFETFKVFQNEVKNQLGKKIKAIRSDRGGEYLSHEFVNHVKSCGIVSQLTPLYTPQYNEVSKKRNRTLLDMVRSMMNLTALHISFWGYALKSTAPILNMVPTKKVERTSYEIWHGKAPKLSYLRVWGYEALVK